MDPKTYTWICDNIDDFILWCHKKIYIGEPVLDATNIQLFSMCRYVMKMMSDFYGGEDNALSGFCQCSFWH